MRPLLLALLLAPIARASDMSQNPGVSPSSAAATYVNKAGDTMTGRLTAPDATLTYGLNVGTISASGSMTASSVTSQGTLQVGSANGTFILDGSLGYGMKVGGNGSSSYIGFYPQGGGSARGGYIGNVGGVMTVGAESSNISLAGGSVGIGTASPATTLDVNGNAQFGSGATKSTFTTTGVLSIPSNTNINLKTGDTTALVKYRTTGVQPGLDVQGDANGPASFANGGVAVGTYGGGGAIPSNGLIVSGNVGIGTASPGTKLHMSSGTLTINGDGGGAVIGFSSASFTNDIALTLSRADGPSTAGSRAVCEAYKDGNNPSLIAGICGVRTAPDGNFNSDLAFYVNTGGAAATTISNMVQRMVIKNDGVVGIGTASPASSLAVSGTTGISIAASGSGSDADGRLRLQHTATYATIDHFKTASGYLPLAFYASGVGIDTITPATKFDVNGNAQFGSGATKSTFTATGFWEPISKTKAQIDLLVPTKVGQVIYASDTTLPGLCVSTGTAAAQWRKMESATLGCGTNN